MLTERAGGELAVRKTKQRQPRVEDELVDAGMETGMPTVAQGTYSPGEESRTERKPRGFHSRRE